MNELEHFSYALVHDMRAPLRAMRGYAELLLPEQQQDTSQNFCRRIIDSADRMDNLIQDSLNYARIMRHHLPKVAIDLHAFVLGLIESYPNLEQHKSKITIQGELPWIQGNHAMLTHCFSNLLNNALKFVPPGEQPRITIRAEKGTGTTVRIWVEDKGVGIPSKDHKRIFDMFQQVSKAYPGTGIGLAVVRKSVERMGGQVGVESEPGKGSRFWVQLDAAL
jgi:signal transduction histidine kinase